MSRIRKQLEAVAGKLALVIAGPRKPLRVEVGDPGECLYVLVSTSEVAGRVFIDVQDSGPGIDVASQSRVFARSKGQNGCSSTKPV